MDKISSPMSTCQSGFYLCHLIASRCVPMHPLNFHHAGVVLKGGVQASWCMLWWGAGSSHSCSQMHTWCHLSRSVIPLVERGVGRSWTMKSGTNQESVAAASWRWGLTHRKQSVRGFRVWITDPAGWGYLLVVLQWLVFQGEQRVHRQLPDHKNSRLNSKVNFLFLFLPHNSFSKSVFMLMTIPA